MEPDRCPKCGGLINSKSTMKRHAIQHENQEGVECQPPIGGVTHGETVPVGSGLCDSTGSGVVQTVPPEDKT